MVLLDALNRRHKKLANCKPLQQRIFFGKEEGFVVI
jgi:hypothetical protein